MCFCERCVADKTQPQWIESSPHGRGQSRLAPDPRPAPGRPLRRLRRVRAGLPGGHPARAAQPQAGPGRGGALRLPRERRPGGAGADRRLPPQTTRRSSSCDATRTSSLAKTWPPSPPTCWPPARAWSAPAPSRRRRASTTGRHRRLAEVVLDGESAAPLPQGALPAADRAAAALEAAPGPTVELEEVPTAFPPTRGPRRAAVRRRGRRGPRPGHGLGLPRRAVVRPPRGDDHHLRSPAPASTTPASAPPSGLAPTRTRGADLLLTPAAGGFLVEVVTDKGERPRSTRIPRASARPPDAEPLDASGARTRRHAGPRCRSSSIRTWLEAHFEHPLWDELALRCHGCGACASVCPTCHCFDIVDEPEGVDRGVRRRNWDTCQTARSSPCTPPGTTRATTRTRASASASCTSSPSTRRSSARCSAPAAAAASAPARPAWTSSELLGRIGSPRREATAQGGSKHEPLPAPPRARRRTSSTRPPTPARCGLEFKDPAVAERSTSAPASSASTRSSAPASAPSASPPRPPARATSSAPSRPWARSPTRCAGSASATPWGSAAPTATTSRSTGWRAASIVFIAGGIGLAPVRCVIWNVLDLRDQFEDVTIIYGARTVGRPRLQARARRVGGASRRQALADRRPRRRDPRLERARSASSPPSSRRPRRPPRTPTPWSAARRS